MTYPKPHSQAMLAELNQYVIAEPKPFVVDIRRSRGLWLATADGDRIMDWCGLYGSRLLGYNHPRLYAADYLERLSFAANNKMANPDFLTEECLAYYRLLHRLAPECMRGQRVEVYAVNSGAEAVENMMKYLINLHHKKLQEKGKTPLNRRFIYFEQAFHGRTVYALNITKLANDPIATRDYQGIIQGNLQVPFPEFDANRSDEENEREVDACLAALEYLMRTYGDEIVGVIFEPMQGAGGHRVALPRFYRELSALCQRFDVSWGLDEVQTSGGQTGKVFCIDLYDVPYPPQAIAVAKKFGNGVIYMLNPMEDVGVLDSTWGGNLADMVRFVEEWQIVEDEHLIEAVPAKTERLVAGLEGLCQRHPARIANVRGMGLYQGFTLLNPADKGALVSAALDREDLLLLGAGTDSIRFRPPLDVSESEIDMLIEKLDRLLGGLEKAHTM
ncbi:aminotransferase class III-fold pyridoxal phosphate-dependent enzyme [Niveibacterium sp. 24ML]|uniref:aminotransferase class III-fold pyridoxal phosphate-dependent enzyme n=1 Tax=Niveibacterium sp. 24ML TaxID=2985512 RepID=UPI00226FD3E3|nr:aminotransferase class III-fold pyridoxal phosphate-dependent enzyme [Niveibacterium sp. 24ML]MCX9157569.1 aminotransferase class III-fold pyridoxal phosphate-dependent enzyme [Niveibacterium sp. 24ML]